MIALTDAGVEHTFYLAADTVADILMVGGGGGGGNYGGGGGGGDVLCLKQQRIPRGRYRMYVGRYVSLVAGVEPRPDSVIAA